MTPSMDKDRLAAFVDGELSPEEAAAVVMHLAGHPEDQAYVDELFAANEALSRAFSAPLHEPVPERIRAVIMEPDARPVVVPFRPRRTVVLTGMALAASVALAAVLLPGLWTGPSPTGIALGPLAADDPVAEILNARVSGDPAALGDGREAMVLASFAMEDGRFCRELELIDRARARLDYAVGCRADDGWRIEGVVAEAIETDAGDGFVAAGDAGTDAMNRLLERDGAAVALDPEAEAEAIRRGWRAP